MLYDQGMNESADRGSALPGPEVEAASRTEAADTDNAGSVRSQPSRLAALFAPWLGMVRPRRAAALLADSPAWLVVLTLLLSSLAIPLVILFLALWEVSNAFGSRYPLRALAAAWSEWHENTVIGLPELIEFFVTTGLMVLTLFVAWLQLAYVHQGESTRKAFKRSVAAVVSCMGWLFALTLLIGWMILARFFMLLGPEELVAFCTIVTFLIFLVYRVAAACESARGPSRIANIDPRCEWCGYNLTHVPETGKCPECGTAVALSLRSDLRRTGVAWEREEGPDHWLPTTLQVLKEPTRFYRSLHVRGDERRGRQFVRPHYVLIGVGAFFWLLTFLLCIGVEDVPGETLCVSVLLSEFAVLAGWGVHRLVGALAFTMCLIRNSLPEPERARRVMAYETAYLWVFCLYNGLLFTSFFLWEAWMSDLVSGSSGSFPGPFRLPLEVVAVLLGNLTLALLWFWRYAIAIRAVRWSNF
jgi:hypothetical protein